MVRHASDRLIQQTAQRRWLLLLSDGKSNDMDHDECRYGVADLRQAVIEAKLQSSSPFCLAMDRQAADYLPSIFGASQYALLPKPKWLPTVWLDWLRRLVGHRQDRTLLAVEYGRAVRNGDRSGGTRWHSAYGVFRS